MAIKPPDDSLSSYFDELLGEPEASPLAESVAVIAPQELTAKVVSLPKKPLVRQLERHYGNGNHLNTYIAPETKTRSLRGSYRELRNFAETDAHHTPTQKQQLEKLLQSARTQLLVGSTPANLKNEEVPLTELAPELKTERLNISEEIQEWVIESDSTQLESPEYSEQSLQVTAVDAIAAETSHTDKLDAVAWLPNGRPSWAQARFDVLLFQVSGLTLAVPLIALGQIRPITEELTPLFGQADWFMGFQLTPRGKISTVNTAKFVMPERYDEAFVKSAKYVVSIDGVPWGLAVDSVNQPISLEPEDVKWRSERSKRPWLAGTVKDHMCALLDIPRIGQLLIEQDKNHTFQAR